MSDLSWLILVIVSFVAGGMLATIFWFIQTDDWDDDED